MAIQTQIVDVPLGGGLAEAVEKKLVQPGSFLKLENVEHLKQGSITKRRGYGYLPDPGQTIERVATRGQDLLGYATGSAPSEAPHIKTYSSALGSWVKNGDSWSVGVERRTVSRHYSGVAAASCLPVGDRVVWVYWSSQEGFYYKVEDSEGVDLSGELPGTSVTSAYLRAAVSGSTVVVVYKSTGGSLRLATIDPTTFAISDGAITLPSTPSTLRFDMIAPSVCPGFVIVAWEDGSSPNARLRVCSINVSTRAVVTSSSGAGTAQPNGQNVLYPHLVENGSSFAVAYSHQVSSPSAARNVRAAQWSNLTPAGTFITSSDFDKIVFSTALTTIGFTNYGAAIVPDASVGGGDGYQVGTVFGGVFRVNQIDDAGDVVVATQDDFRARAIYLFAGPPSSCRPGSTDLVQV
jgi:hypothetical protein